MDITSLYTVIPNGEGLLALKHFFDLRTVKEPSSETLLRLAELVLTLNWFSFATSYYKQINGVAMGTKMGPSYANLFVGYIEHKFFNQYNGPKPELYRRFTDCVGATSSTREELNQFITAVNSFHPAIKYTWDISNTSLAFLDIKVSVEGNGLCTSVHYKPTDSHSYLLYSSVHIHHTSRILFLILSFLDFVAFVVRTLIFPLNQRKCAIFSTNVDILPLLFKQAIIAPNKLIGSQHYKRLRRRIIIEFHSPSHFTSQSRSKIHHSQKL